MHTRAIQYAALLTIFISSVAVAADTGKKLSAEQYERRIEQLEKDVQDLKQDSRKPTVAAAEQSTAKPVAGYQDGFFIQSPDGINRLVLSTWTHFDGRFFLDKGDQGTSQFVFRRVRLDLRGTFLKYFDARFMEDFSGGKATLFDAYLNVHYVEFARLELGKFKAPVGLERLQSASNLLFVERAYPTSIVPNRDLGLMLHGDLFNAALTYQVGIFDGGADGTSNSNDLDINDEKMFAGRVFAHPFKNLSLAPLRGLGLGLSGTFAKEIGTVSNPDLPQYKTFGQQTFFSYVTNSPATAAGTAVASGDQSRLSPQAYWYWGQFGSMAEYAWSQQDVTQGTTEKGIQADAWHVRASWVVTGEAASYKGVVPAKPFDPFDLSAGNWGALEVAARGTQLHVNHDAFALGFANPDSSAREATEWAIAANWYLNRNIFLALDFARTTFAGGKQGGRDRTPEEVIISRVQFLL